MSDFKAKMRQIQFRLGLGPRPRWELTALPDLLAGFKGLHLREGMKKAGNGTGKGKGRKEDGKRRRREGKGGRNEKGRGAYRDEGPKPKS